MYELKVNKTGIKRLTANNFEVEVTYSISVKFIVKEVGKLTVPMVLSDDPSIFKTALRVALRNKLDMFLELEAARAAKWIDRVIKEVEENGNQKLNPVDDTPTVLGRNR